MKNPIIRLVVFALLNFLALGIGSMFTGEGVTSNWYTSLEQAPWTPPGWVFGAAWTTIMVCFTIYLTVLWPRVQMKKSLLTLFGIQWILNVAWNPVFFNWRQPVMALFIISLLTLLIAIIARRYVEKLGAYSWLIAPYLVWLLIATSLNAYIVFFN